MSFCCEDLLLSRYESKIAIAMSTNDADPRLIESIPPVLWKTIPAGQPPPGIQADFKDPPTMVPIILGVSIAFMTLAVFCFSIRIYTKLVMTNNWRWDDCELLSCILERLSGSEAKFSA